MAQQQHGMLPIQSVDLTLNTQIVWSYLVAADSNVTFVPSQSPNGHLKWPPHTARSPLAMSAKPPVFVPRDSNSNIKCHKRILRFIFQIFVTFHGIRFGEIELLFFFLFFLFSNFTRKTQAFFFFKFTIICDLKRIDCGLCWRFCFSLIQNRRQHVFYDWTGPAIELNGNDSRFVCNMTQPNNGLTHTMTMHHRHCHRRFNRTWTNKRH